MEQISLRTMVEDFMDGSGVGPMKGGEADEPEWPIISVIVPTYQHAPYIKECLDSILAQRLSVPFEVIVGDDGSTDGTLEICRSFAKAYPTRVRLLEGDRRNVIHIDGSPTGRANVYVLTWLAKGRYIAICDGDDRWDSIDKLSRQLAVLEADPAIAGVYHETGVMDGNGKGMGMFRQELPVEFDKDNIISTLAPFHTSSFMYRARSYFTRRPGWYDRVGSFDMLLFNLVLGDGRLVKVDGIRSTYRKHEGGITSRAHNQGEKLHAHRMALWICCDRDLGGYSQERIALVLHEHMRTLKAKFGTLAAVKGCWRTMRIARSRMLLKPSRMLRMLQWAMQG